MARSWGNRFQALAKWNGRSLIEACVHDDRPDARAFPLPAVHESPDGRLGAAHRRRQLSPMRFPLADVRGKRPPAQASAKLRTAQDRGLANRTVFKNIVGIIPNDDSDRDRYTKQWMAIRAGAPIQRHVDQQTLPSIW